MMVRIHPPQLRIFRRRVKAGQWRTQHRRRVAAIRTKDSQLRDHASWALYFKGMPEGVPRAAEGWLWDLELGARVIRPEEAGIGSIPKLDEPRNFAAYLHALKWNCVTATDAHLFQAPFRAGIKLLRHQLLRCAARLRMAEWAAA
jgi:hypothetical protein